MKFILLVLIILISNVTISAAQNQPATTDTLAAASYPAAHNTGTLKDFPKLHPLVVHIPIACIILAFIIQLISFFVFKKELSWVALVLIIVGFIGAYLAAGIFHGGDPKLSLLDPVSRATFEKHEQYAGYTVWMSGIAALAKIISHFFLKRKLITEIIVIILMATASYCVTIAGDMGSRLVHIDDIGPQGKHLPAHDEM